MFDIGFAELLLVAVVGLLVLGPERLPGAIKTGALWVGRLRRSFNQIKNDISREIGADEIRQQLHNESILESLEKDKERLLDLDRQLQKAQQETENVTNAAVTPLNKPQDDQDSSADRQQQNS